MAEEKKEYTGGKEHTGAAGVTKFLKGVHFPAKKQDLIRHARENHAGQDVIHTLEMLQDREYRTMAEVEKEFGKAA